MPYINTAYEIERLLDYAKRKGLIATQPEPVAKLETIYLRNNLMTLLNVDTPFEGELQISEPDLHEILNHLLNDAVRRGMIENSVTQKDLLDTKIMGLLTPAPSHVIRYFKELISSKGAEAATDYFYNLNQDVNYIRMDRIRKNRHWTVETEYGEIEITINLSKPEKEPLELKKAINTPATSYPKCVLCIENMGFQGNAKRPARQNHRLIPVELCNENWYFQYSPYVYYDEHCILIYETHKPMHICRQTFERLFQFLEKFPHYFIGSNTDLPIVGGSILEHEHYQGGRYKMPMVNAKIDREYDVGVTTVKAGILHWPLSCIRMSSKDKRSLVDLSEKILKHWRTYSDKEVAILHKSIENGKTIPHNTITPITRINSDGEYEIDVVLRNNRTTEEFPRGLFHPHPELHHIKKENIGLIEVMGLAILPGRLEREIEDITEYLTNDKKMVQLAAIKEEHPLYKHKKWIEEMKNNNINGNKDEVIEKIRVEIGRLFTRVLEDAGVYKNNQQGKAAFHRFMVSCGFKIK